MASLASILSVPEEIRADLIFPTALRIFKGARSTVELVGANGAISAVILHVTNILCGNSAAVSALERVIRIWWTAAFLQVEIVNRERNGHMALDASIEVDVEWIVVLEWDMVLLPVVVITTLSLPKTGPRIADFTKFQGYQVVVLQRYLSSKLLRRPTHPLEAICHVGLQRL